MFEDLRKSWKVLDREVSRTLLRFMMGGGLLYMQTEGCSRGSLVPEQLETKINVKHVSGGAFPLHELQGHFTGPGPLVHVSISGTA